MRVLVNVARILGTIIHVNMLVMRVVMPVAVCMRKSSMYMLVFVLLPCEQDSSQNHQRKGNEERQLGKLPEHDQ